MGKNSRCFGWCPDLEVYWPMRNQFFPVICKVSLIIYKSHAEKSQMGCVAWASADFPGIPAGEGRRSRAGGAPGLSHPCSGAAWAIPVSPLPHGPGAKAMRFCGAWLRLMWGRGWGQKRGLWEPLPPQAAGEAISQTRNVTFL